METSELLKLTIMDAKERKGEYLKLIPCCPDYQLEMILSLTEALALVELRAQHLYLCSLRAES